MFLYQFFKRLSEKRNFSFHSENNDPANPDGPGVNERVNFCRCPIRTFEAEPFSFGESHEHFRIFHVRDPRDILVSEYFSVAWIHPTEDSKLDQRRESLQKISIDDYVLNQSAKSAWPLEEKFVPLLERDLDPKRDVVVTYEEMVTDFQSWVEKVLPAFDIRFPKLMAYKLAWRYRNEFKVNGEAMRHKRRITPGDHRDKLQPSTIDELNQRFEPVLKRFGYLT